MAQQLSVDDEWESFLTAIHSTSNPASSIYDTTNTQTTYPNLVFQQNLQTTSTIPKSPPPCGELHISTKTKVLFLNSEIDTLATFWSIPVVDYWRPVEGVIKKQLKIISNTPEEYDALRNKLDNCQQYYSEMAFKTINNPTSKRLKFKDDRKITIGISKKDIMNCRGKPKKAFMNCFAIIIRFWYAGEFREIHVKVFNTGKLEIPGVPDDAMLEMVRAKVIEYLQPYLPVNPLHYIREAENEDDEDVLINSDFRCGFFINQKAFYGILKSDKYGIETSYDSCHYPGIRCKYYYRHDLPATHPDQNGRICAEDNGIKLSQLELSKKYTCVSFMIFSTGSCLIVGNCSKRVLLHVYDFMKNLLQTEYEHIAIATDNSAIKIKKKKQRKRTVVMQMSYLNSIIGSDAFATGSESDSDDESDSCDEDDNDVDEAEENTDQQNIEICAPSSLP